MIPSEPTRQPQMGFLFFPPFRVQGYSIAGEETCVQVPELGVCFDIGRCPRLALTSDYVALSHGHMDHAAGLAYYFSQRHFQGMGVGTVVCHPALARPITRLMDAWVAIEAQRTPCNIRPLADGQELEIKNHVFLRAFETDHTVPSLGFAVVEKRSKLKEQYIGLPQEKLLELKQQGTEITYIKQVPLVAYMGDTSPGKHFARDDVRQAQILICECTFLDPDHKDRARVGKHLHLDHIVELLEQVDCPHLVLTHLSRRTHLAQARRQVEQAVPPQHRHRVHLLMDSRANRARYQQQLAEAQSQAQESD